MSIKEWIKWDYSEVEDPSYKNELKANKFLGITLFFAGVISLLCLILRLCGVFDLGNNNTALVVLFSVITFFSLTGFLIEFLTNGKKTYVKFSLLFDLIVITVVADMVLAFNAVLFLVVPLLCVSRYANTKLSIRVFSVLALMILVDGFIAYFTNVQFDYNPLQDITIQKFLVGEDVSYWEYTGPILKYSVMPREFIFILIGALSIVNASNARTLTNDEVKHRAIEQRITGELSFAKALQESMLPQQYPAFPNVDSFDVCGSMIPAKEIGGDMYDYFLIDDQHLGIVIADVSGKGVAASLFMGMTKVIAKNMLYENPSLEVAMARVNDMIVNDNKLGLFVTSWIGVLDLHSGELTYVNAGHNFPILYKDGNLTFLKDKSGIALGVVGKKMYKEYKILLKPGDRLLIYTDGVTDAVNKDNELYTAERLFDFVKANIKSTDNELVNDILKELSTYQEGRGQFDDITMVSLTFKSYLEKKNVRKEFVATVENFAAVSDFIEETLTDYDVNLKYINQINIAVEEIFTNIAKYGFKGQSNGKATVDITFVNGTVTVTTYDNSPKFDPFTRKDPDITLTAEDRPIGGLGLLMVKKLMDEVGYKYENETNIISLTKKVF